MHALSHLHFSGVHEVDSKVKGIAQLGVGVLFRVLLAPSHGSQATFYMPNSRQLSIVGVYRQTYIVAEVIPIKHLRLGGRCCQAVPALRLPQMEL